MPHLDHILARRPPVSVLMPVRNGDLYLRQSVMSILEQTFCDLELIAIDDGSSDGSVEILAEFARRDRRVRLRHHRGPHGIANALNWGIAFASGRYIARLDADDIAAPDRIEKQVRYLEAHPDIDLLGTALKMIDAHGEFVRLHGEPVGWLSVLFHTLFGTPFAHPSMLIRSELFQNRGYRYREVPAQDYDLWVRILNDGHRGDNLPEALTLYRLHLRSDSEVRAVEHGNAATALAVQQLLAYIPHLAGTCTEQRLRVLGHCMLTDNPILLGSEDEHFANLLLKALDGFLSCVTDDRGQAQDLRILVSARLDRHLSGLGPVRPEVAHTMP